MSVKQEIELIFLLMQELKVLFFTYFYGEKLN